MSFHKHIFPIRTILEDPIKIVKGWRMDGTEIGFHKDGRYWVATDLYSGLRICKAETRRACVEWIENHRWEISDKMQEPWYAQKVCEFRDLLKTEMAKLEAWEGIFD